MAELKPCKSCKKEISTDAAACPQCGDPDPHESKKVSGKETAQGCLGIIILGLVAMFALSLCSGSEEADPVAEAEKKRKGFHCLSEWDGAHPEFKYEVKQSMRNPKSFEHDSTRVTPVNDQGIHIITMTYRAENGFGGMTSGTAYGTYENSDCKHVLVSVE